METSGAPFKRFLRPGLPSSLDAVSEQFGEADSFFLIGQLRIGDEVAVPRVSSSSGLVIFRLAPLLKHLLPDEEAPGNPLSDPSMVVKPLAVME